MQRGLPWKEQKRNHEQRESHYWKDMSIGHEFESLVFDITEDLVQDVLGVTDDRNAIYLNDTAAKKVSLPKKVAPQAISVIFGRLSYLGDKYRPAPGGMVLELSFSFVKPTYIGDRITSKAKIVAKEERKGKKIFGIRAELYDQSGELVSIMEQSGMLPL